MTEPQAKRARPAPLEARVSTLALPTLGKIYALAVDIYGTVFVATALALYAISLTGFLTLLAGSSSEKGYKDGQGDTARFNQPRGLTVARDGTMLVLTLQQQPAPRHSSRHRLDRRGRGVGLRRWRGHYRTLQLALGYCGGCTQHHLRQ